MDPVLTTGTVLGDRYRAIRLRWPTAAGPVWQARDLVLDRDVLLFTLAPDVAGEAHARDALIHAASRSAGLIDANIAQVYDCSSDPPYLVSELPGGGRLAEQLADKPLPLREAARVVCGVAHALRVLHEHGIAHGAVGPAWIGTDEEGRAKLMGIGFVDVATIAGHLRGGRIEPALQPAGYPEPDPEPQRSDRRALAALAFHMLTGKPPGSGVTLAKAKIPSPLAATIERGIAEPVDLRTFESAFAPHAAPPALVEREPGFLRTEGRWLAGVLLAVGVAIGLAVASLGIVRSLGTKTPAQKASAAPSAQAIPIVSVRDFDPPPGNGEEHPDQVDRVKDGDPASSWFTVGYATGSFGGAKPGVGLLFDLGSPRKVGQIRIATPISGWRGEIRVADASAADAASYRVVDTFTAVSDLTLTLDKPVEGRYWLVWITALVDQKDGSSIPYKAAVGEVRFLAA